MNSSVKVVVGLAALAFVVAGCSGQETVDPSGSSSTSTDVVALDLSESIEHVHGLVAVTSDAVVAGTHSGARRIDSAATVSAPGQSRDDLMGMTGEAGTSRLATSGHPGEGSSLPNPVGLLVSDDAGATWTPVSLQGEVDFHALAVSGDDVIGYGGGASLMVSSDAGTSWKDGAPVQAAALAYSDERILATTQAGLQVSTDGGASFTPVAGAPVLTLISAGTDQTVLGLDPDGGVWSSTDQGKSWSNVGQAPEAEAIAAFADGQGYAVSQSQLFIIK